MPAAVLIKPTHKAIKQYYQSLKEYSAHRVIHEGALETAFSNLLAAAARAYGWQLIPKQSHKIGKHTIIPDGTLRDLFTRRGYWEAKDTSDDLDQEISKKLAQGYPTSNTIFEDTRQAVLYQSGIERDRFDLADPQQLARLLNEFFSYTEPEIDGFHQAVTEFQTRVPELAGRLVTIITEAHQKNKKFQQAFDGFFALCQQTLNPNISQAAVDEMLVQHLLTERLIRKIFDNQEFTRRNVIAAEIEKVIEALISVTFSRDQFLKSLDRFYRAIEDAAHILEDFGEKQQFLNTVYERFFQGYSVKVADTHGIVYTPQPIVDFMCASVEEVLKTEFGLTLGSKGVNILDPCTGTGNFIVNLIRRIPKRDLPRVYKEQLFANEVMLLPYYIAALNIEHAYFEITGEYQGFEGLCFVDTLDLVNGDGTQRFFEFMTEENTARVVRQKSAPITVIIGNPPYNVGQINENDQNKNRKYSFIDRRVKETFGKASKATSVSKLNDPYVKFFRWALDRLEDRDGIVCFVTNNSFVDQLAFDGMRRHLAREFSRIYHIHLEGNVRRNPTLSGTQYNVFGIQVGVGITVAVRRRKHRRMSLRFHRVDKKLRRAEKLDWLAKHAGISEVKWRKIDPDPDDAWLAPANGVEFARFLPIGSKEGRSAEWNKALTLFQEYGLGVATHRDKVVYDFDRPTLVQRVKEFIDAYNGEVDRYRRAGGKADLDTFVRYDKIVWDRDLKKDLARGRYAEFADDKIRHALYHPFTKRFLFFDRIINAEVYTFPKIMPTAKAEAENRMVCVPGPGGRANWATIITDRIPNLSLTSLDTFQCFPFYIYDEDGTNRRENITDWALEQFRTHYTDRRAEGRKPSDSKSHATAKGKRGMQQPGADAPRLAERTADDITKWDIFYYVYGLLHHPGYRTKFADNLKRELPRIPFAPDFWAFADAGKELARLHLDYEKLEPYELKFIETPGMPLSYHVEDKMRLSKDKTSLKVNPSLTLAGIPPEVFDYRLGNRSALDWVIDQYQVSEDKRSGIRSDPNRPDDPEYIVKLVGQVVRVSIETVKIVQGLPERFAD